MRYIHAFGACFALFFVFLLTLGLLSQAGVNAFARSLLSVGYLYASVKLWKSVVKPKAEPEQQS